MTDTHEITIEHEGEDETHTVEVEADEYVLDAALEAGIELPFSCRSGNCTTCTGELLSGEVDQGEGTALEPDQREDGYVLLCSAYPRGDCRVRAGEGLQEELLGLDLDVF